MKKSKGHITFQTTDFGVWEWYEQAGQVFKAPAANPLDLNGYRQGGRWECSQTHFERYREHLLK